MNKTASLVTLLAGLTTVLAQNPIPIPSLNPAAVGRAGSQPGLTDSQFTKFDIDFPGGPPAKLVHTIVTQSGTPLNVIIPPEFESTELPPLSMRNVSVPRLFEAINQASRKTVSRITGWNNYSPGLRTPNVQISTMSIGFRTAGPTTPESIWYFFVDEPPSMPDVPEPQDPSKATACRFYQLGPYLDGGSLRVEDITTAVETAWKMLETPKPPTLKFHKETRLLIAVGPADRLSIIDEVLAQLSPAPHVDPNTGLPVRVFNRHAAGDVPPPPPAPQTILPPPAPAESTVTIEPPKPQPPRR